MFSEGSHLPSPDSDAVEEPLLVNSNLAADIGPLHMENQSKGAGRVIQRWFESEAETALGYWGGGLGGRLHPRAKMAGKRGWVAFHWLQQTGMSVLEARLHWGPLV